MGQVINQARQYQWGQPLFQLGMLEAIPSTSPRTKYHITCMAGRRGAKRAQIHAQKIEMMTKRIVLQTNVQLNEPPRSMFEPPANFKINVRK